MGHAVTDPSGLQVTPLKPDGAVPHAWGDDNANMNELTVDPNGLGLQVVASETKTPLVMNAGHWFGLQLIEKPKVVVPAVIEPVES